MKEPFPHDFRAILAAPAKGLSPRKILAASLFLTVGYALYVIFTYLALLIDGVSFDYIRQSYGFFPIQWFTFDAITAKVLYLGGMSLTVLSVSLSIMSVAVITFEELRGDFFFSAFDAIRFALGRLPTMLLGFISLGIFVGFIYLLGILAGLVARIPYIGELLIGVFYIIPIFLTLVFTVFVVFVAFTAVVLLPVIIAAQKRKEVFDSLLQLFSVIIKEPLRFAWYMAVTALLAKLASFVLAYLFYRTFQFSRMALSTGGGDRIDRLFNSALAILPTDSQVVTFMTQALPGVHFGFSFSRWSYSADQSVGAVLLAISFFLLFIVIYGYAVSVLSVGLSRGYAVIRRMKDDYLIVDEEPLSPGDDYANPPLQKDNRELS